MTDTTYDIAAVGECLIDFAPAKQQEPGKLLFSGCPGGAPANVLACAAKLGLHTAFIGKVGDDVFGRLLRQTLDGCGIDTSAMIVSPDYLTTLAFVSLDEQGDRSFSFYRNETADCMITTDELDAAKLSGVRIFHFGSVSMTVEPSRTTTMEAVRAAKENGALISYDPNLRELLWDSLDEAKTVILDGFLHADVVKLSEEELFFLTGAADFETGMDMLFRQYGLKLLVVTLGAEGSLCLGKNGFVRSGGFAVHAVDTTGAGDTFWGSFLYRILTGKLDADDPAEGDVAAALRFANAAGALSTTQPGAIPSMPTLEEISNMCRP